jgi:glycogen debranching enzyme GlgX/4-alpha-glucanotransferase
MPSCSGSSWRNGTVEVLRLGRVTSGQPEPLGVSPTRGGVNMAVASTTATAIEVCFFDEDGREQRVGLPDRTGDVFHGHVEGPGAGARYGLRAHGPDAPERGHRFQPAKLLMDPYAVMLDGPYRLHPAMFASSADDSAGVAPKAVVMAPEGARPAPDLTPWNQTFIYEAHVRGLTLRHPGVPEEIRGTFAALGHPAIAAHLRDLGVTTLELLPAAAWIDERHLQPLGLTNYWGYNPVAFCAPDPRLAPGGWTEVAAATAALAAAGIETVLDVVFNHTGEGDALGPTLSLRGLDNRGSYWLQPDDPARYVDDTGTGNTLRLDTVQGVRLAMEAMRTWRRRGGIAGFRFDLAPVLGRRAGGFDPSAPLLAAIAQDPELRALKLIAEPWDCGPGGYQLGRFPAGWGEWNDQYRDTVRRFWRSDAASLGGLAGVLAGSEHLFGARGRTRSINFVTAHDGFTLRDLVSYQAKQNTLNGEQNRDGTDGNLSWNCGVEGPSEDPGVVARRDSDRRALLATLLLSRGIPMLAMGDELGRSQGGNNNAYAQDNPLSWVDWADADRGLARFVGRLAQARAAHTGLHDDRFLTGELTADGVADVAWRTVDGRTPEDRDWDDPQGTTLQMILAAGRGPGRVAVVLHRGSAAVDAVLPTPRSGCGWRLQVDSRNPERVEVLDGEVVTIGPRSVLLLEEAPVARPSRRSDDAAVAKLALAAGVQAAWWGLDGVHHAVSPETQRALLAAMGLPADNDEDAQDSLWRLQHESGAPLPACRVVREGEPVIVRTGTRERWLSIEREDGGFLMLPTVDGQVILPPLPLGVHRLRLGEACGALIVAPRGAHEPEALARGARVFGISAQLYSLRRREDAGIGDLTTLAALGRIAAAAGASLVALNPLHALFPADRDRASPYHPSDRRFIDPIYLDVEALPGDLPTDAGATTPGAVIDYQALWVRKSAALERIVTHIEQSHWERADLERFIHEGGEALARFCTFEAIAERHPREPWTRWPAQLRAPDGGEVAAFTAAHRPRLRHHQILQWLCDRQLAQAAAAAPGFGLCRDLAVGAAPDGAEVWSAQGDWALGASIGAPPDAMAPQGQVWGLPPPVPGRWKASAYHAFRELLATNMRHAGALRIDHVLGLSRLFWVPAGADGADGAYVTSPQDDLVGVVALASARAGCLVIGEDLGTVPDGLREALGRASIYSYRVLPFERDGEALKSPAAYTQKAVACVSTHDLPTLAGWWCGADIEERARLGLLSIETVSDARSKRRHDKRTLLVAVDPQGARGWRPDDVFGGPLAGAIHGFIAASASQLMLIQADDLAGESIAVNLPGTDLERSNWRRRVSVNVEDLASSDLALDILAAVRASRVSAEAE